MAATTFNPSWSDSVKWESSTGGNGFGGGVSPGSSFEPPSGFPSAGDSEFWKNQPTDPDYYTGKGKNFLDTFVKALGDVDKDKYRNQAQQGGFQSGGGRGDSYQGANVGKLTDNLSIYTPPTYSPFTIQGVQGSPGFGGTIGKIGGAVVGSLIPGVGPGLGSTIGGTIGGAFG